MRALYMKLAFGVLDLENFKSALLRLLDADVATPASQTRVWQTLYLEVTSGSSLRPASVFLIYASRLHILHAGLKPDCVQIQILCTG